MAAHCDIHRFSSFNNVGHSLQSPEERRAFVKLVLTEAEFVGVKELTQFTILGAEPESMPSDVANSTLTVKLVFRRRSLATIMTLFLPTITFCMTAFASSYVGPAYFNTVVTVNLTIMLVIITMFADISAQLPSSGFVKTVEVKKIYILHIYFGGENLKLCSVAI